MAKVLLGISGFRKENTSTSEEWINFTNPEVAVISVGKNNKFGHPNKETLDAFKEIELMKEACKIVADLYEYLEKIKSDECARNVKIADIRHNMDISRIPCPRIRKAATRLGGSLMHGALE